VAAEPEPLAEPEPSAEPEPGLSEPVSARDLLWRDAAAELAPAKSLARMDERARQVVTGVGLVGTLLTGLGVVAGTQVNTSALTRGLALAAVCAATLAVLIALAMLLVRFPRRVAIGDLAEVESSYLRQFQRGYGVVAAGLVLLVAVVLAGITAITVLVNGSSSEPTVAAQVTGVGDEAKLSVRVRIPGMAAGQLVRTEVVGVSGASRTTLAQAADPADADGVGTSTMDVPKIAGYSRIEVIAVAVKHRCIATVDLTGGSGWTVTCDGG